MAVASNASSFSSIFPSLNNSVHYVTNGSKNLNNVFGVFAALSNLGDWSYEDRTSNNVSIFTLEALAIIHTLNNALDINIFTVKIFSDSMSVLSALSSNNNYNKKSFLILTILNLSARFKFQGKNIKFYWVPVHKEIAINELADKKAKNAIVKSTDI